MSTIRIGDLAVNRLGLGAMRVIDNDDIWGEPKDRANSLKVLRRAVELGIDFFDTAESYGSQTSETLIAEALYPREGLLAQAVLRGKTIGYVHQTSPVSFIAEYLRSVHAEAASRGYRFAGEKIGRSRATGRLAVSRGQLRFEWHHLLEKLRTRDPKWRARLAAARSPRPHPLLRVVRGKIAPWKNGAG